MMAHPNALALLSLLALTSVFACAGDDEVAGPSHATSVDGPAGAAADAGVGVGRGSPPADAASSATSVPPSPTDASVVVDAAPSPAPSSNDAGAVPDAPTAVPLPPLTIPDVEAAGFDETWTGQSIVGANGGANASDGVVRTAKLASFGGVMQPVYERRTKLGDPAMFHGHRAEFSWFGQAPKLEMATDYWFAVAIRPIAGEWPAQTALGDDIHIWFQIHGYADNESGPIFAIARRGSDDAIIIERAWGSGAGDTYTSLGAGTGSALLAPDVWHRVVLHLRFGATLADAPALEMTIDDVPRLSLTGADAFMGDAADLGAYPKLGIYFWHGDDGAGEAYAGTPTRAMFHSDLFFGQGAALRDRASASVAAFR